MLPISLRVRCLRPTGLIVKSGDSMSLYENINKRKKEGTSRTKSKSTIDPKQYAEMKKGFPKSPKNKTKK
jgi:hypothetical protein